MNVFSQRGVHRFEQTKGGILSIKIAYLIPGTGLHAEERQRRNRILSQLAKPGTCIELIEVEEGPQSIESEADEQAAIPHLVKLAAGAQNDYDGFIIGCYSDLGIDALRKTVDVPVVGPVRASFSTAGAAFEKFSIMTINHDVIPILERQVQRLGFADNVSEIDAVEIGVLDIIAHPEDALERFARSLERVGSGAVVPGCMSYAYLLAEKGIAQMGRVHIVNPLHVSVSIAESMLN